MHTTKEWWSATKSSSDLLIAWLEKQYHGEVTAADRIEKYAMSKAKGPTLERLKQIAKEERRHAYWVGGLLRTRGVEPNVLEKNERYWQETLKDLTDLNSVCAVAAHAEKMRLERIEEIAGDEAAPSDVRKVFQRILVDEVRHERTFAQLAGDQALKNAVANHQNGLKAIGLITVKEVL